MGAKSCPRAVKISRSNKFFNIIGFCKLCDSLNVAFPRSISYCLRKNLFVCDKPTTANLLIRITSSTIVLLASYSTCCCWITCLFAWNRLRRRGRLRFLTTFVEAPDDDIDEDEEELDEGAKPDFLDLDKDGDKKEPMKKAAKEADSEDEDTNEAMIREAIRKALRGV